MLKFFKDPFGTKRIAKLRGEKTATLFKVQQLVEEKQKLHEKIAAKNAEIADLQTQIARVPVNMAAEHALRQVAQYLPESQQQMVKGVLSAKPLVSTPYPPRGPLARLDDPL